MATEEAQEEEKEASPGASECSVEAGRYPARAGHHRSAWKGSRGWLWRSEEQHASCYSCSAAAGGKVWGGGNDEPWLWVGEELNGDVAEGQMKDTTRKGGVAVSDGDTAMVWPRGLRMEKKDIEQQPKPRKPL